VHIDRAGLSELFFGRKLISDLWREEKAAKCIGDSFPVDSIISALIMGRDSLLIIHFEPQARAIWTKGEIRPCRHTHARLERSI
jgi:hypothetical protein